MSVLSSRHPLIQPVAPAKTKSNIFSLFSNTNFFSDIFALLLHHKKNHPLHTALKMTV
jgi:hypothetical protein